MMVNLTRITPLLLLSSCINAFSPNSITNTNPAAKRVELARAKVLETTPVNEYTKYMKMVAGGAAAEEYYEGVRIGPPPDLPSLLLHNRIVYIGMPLVPAVTELIIAELLYLNYESTDPITMYINSSGTTTTAQGQQA